MQVIENFPLKKLNTFGVEVNAAWYLDVREENDLHVLFTQNRWKNYPHLVLGGGSNMLFTSDYQGLVVHIKIQGIRFEII
jgi:UDP-N-acetylmuramate dehydrogenase